MSKNTPPTDFFREKNAMFKTVQDALSTQNFQTEAEINAFMEKNFTGRPMAEVVSEFKDASFDNSPRGRAEAKLDQIDPSSSTPTNRRLALAATKIDPSLINAWFTLAETYESPAKAKAAYQKAINLGKKEFSNLIEDCLALSAQNDPEEKSWLWGHHEARPFLMAHEGLAELYISQDKVGQGIATYEEILRLNGNDNQGIRYRLLPFLMIMAEHEKLEHLLAAYDDCSAEWLYCKALYTFQKITTQMEDEGTWEFVPPADPQAVKDLILLPQLPSECEEANTILAQAIESNALAPLFLCDTRCASFSTSDGYVPGGADEAFTVSQNSSLPWVLDTLALLWLQESCFGPLHRDTVMKALDKHHAHVSQLDEMLDQLAIETIRDHELAEPTRVTAHLRKLVLNKHSQEDGNIISIDQQ